MKYSEFPSVPHCTEALRQGGESLVGEEGTALGEKEQQVQRPLKNGGLWVCQGTE